MDQNNPSIDQLIQEYVKKINIPPPKVDLTVLTSELQSVLLNYDESNPRQRSLFNLLNYYAENIVSQESEYDTERGQTREVSRPLGDFTDSFEKDQGFNLVHPESEKSVSENPVWVQIYYGITTEKWGLLFIFRDGISYKLNPMGFSDGGGAPITDTEKIRVLSEFVSQKIVPLLRFNMKNHLLLWHESKNGQWLPYLESFLDWYRHYKYRLESLIESFYREKRLLREVGYFKEKVIGDRMVPLSDIVNQNLGPIKRIFEGESMKQFNLPLSTITEYSFYHDLYQNTYKLTKAVRKACQTYQQGEHIDRVSNCLEVKPISVIFQPLVGNAIVLNDIYHNTRMAELKEKLKAEMIKRGTFPQWSPGYTRPTIFLSLRGHPLRSDSALVRDYGIGNEDKLNFLVKREPLPSLGFNPEDATTRSPAILNAARDGWAEVLVDLHNNWELGAADARAWDNLALRTAAANGHPEVLRVLHDLYGLDGDDARTMENVALRAAAANGHTAVLRVLHDLYGLTRDDASANEGEALKRAMENGHVETAQALAELWGISKDELDSAKRREFLIQRLIQMLKGLAEFNSRTVWYLNEEGFRDLSDQLNGEADEIMNDIRDLIRKYESTTGGLESKKVSGVTNQIEGRINQYRDNRDKAYLLVDRINGIVAQIRDANSWGSAMILGYKMNARECKRLLESTDQVSAKVVKACQNLMDTLRRAELSYYDPEVAQIVKDVKDKKYHFDPVRTTVPYSNTRVAIENLEDLRDYLRNDFLPANLKEIERNYAVVESLQEMGQQQKQQTKQKPRQIGERRVAPVTLFFKTLIGKTYSLDDLRPDTTIQEIKDLLEPKMKRDGQFPPREPGFAEPALILIYSGKPVENEATVASLNLSNNDQLNIIVRREFDTRLGFDPEDETTYNLAIIRAAEEGWVEVLKELAAEGLTANDAFGFDRSFNRINAALQAASRRGDVEVLKVLRRELGLTPDDADNYQLLKEATLSNNPEEAVRYLKDEFGLNREHAIQTLYEFTHHGISTDLRRMMRAIEILEDEFGITVADIRNR